MGSTAAAAGGLEAAALPFSPLTSKDPIDPGEGSSVKCATARAQLVAPNLFQTERNCAELAIPKIARSLRCHELSESARPRADLPPSPNCMRILQTVWRREGDSNSRDPSDSWSEFGGAPVLRESESHSLCSLSGRRSLRARMRTVFCSVRVCFFRLEPVVVYFSLPLPSAFQAVRSFLHPDP